MAQRGRFRSTARAYWDRYVQKGLTLHEALLVLASAAVCVGPVGHCGGQPYYLGVRPDCPHATDAWSDDVFFASTALVLALCTLGYATTARGLKVGLAHRVSAVVAIATAFVMLHMLTLSRRVEIAVAERTGWGLWSCVPYVFACITFRPRA